MHQLSRILLDMNALDTDDFPFRNTGLLVRVENQLPFAHNRVVELADLIALRQIGVEVVLAVEAGILVDLRLDRHAGAHSLTDTFRIRNGQHAGHRRIDQRNLRVGLCAEFSRSSAEQLGIAGDLRVDFKANHDLPFAGGALDTICAHRFCSRSGVLPVKRALEQNSPDRPCRGHLALWLVLRKRRFPVL